MEKTRALDQIPSRIKYYLLDWKDHNMEKYLKRHEVRLSDLNEHQLYLLFCYATTEDRVMLSKK
jgi:hypothetical protein